MKTFQTSSGATWNLEKPVRTSMPIFSEYGKGTGILTGKWEEQMVCEETVCMVEVKHDFGSDMIFEDFISQ